MPGTNGTVKCHECGVNPVSKSGDMCGPCTRALDRLMKDLKKGGKGDKGGKGKKK